MSNYIVLVKQVPDISQITDNVFNPETGNLIRSRLASVINDLDARALAFAHQMKMKSNDPDGQIICLTMGPPMAVEVLRYSLSRGADRAVLLTDRVLSGADTWATANPLAYAIRKIVKEILGGSSNYYIISGMQSVDGDTAQVPPQIAEELQIPCVAYVTGAEYKDNRFEFTRIISGGSQVVALKKLPAVLTVAKYDYPLYASFTATRRASRANIITWSNEDIKAAHTGVKGSKTRVVRVFPPPKSSRKRRQVKNVRELARAIMDDLQEKEVKNGLEGDGATAYLLPEKRPELFDRHYEGTEKEIEDFQLLARVLDSLGIVFMDKIDTQSREKLLEATGLRPGTLADMLAGLKVRKPSYTGEVWVAAEHREGKIHASTFELIGKARELADSLDTKVGVCLAGYNIDSSAGELIAAGADNIYVIENELLEVFDPVAHRKVVADAINTYHPQICLFAATPRGRMLAPMVSYRVGCGLTADCTSLTIGDNTRRGQVGILFQTRPALGGNIMATIVTKNSPCQMATARPGIMKRLEPDNSRKGTIITHQVELSEDDISLEIIKTEHLEGEVNFAADAIVSGGKGIQSRDNFERLVGSLCQAFIEAGIDCEQGASRAAVEQGFIDRPHQVGQTGTAVGPRLYIALGISGAIQHMIGVSGSKTVVAINNDPEAPIFKESDYYLVGAAEEVVPKLVHALEVNKNGT